MPLKLEARARGLDSFWCKVEQLRLSMSLHAASVALVIDKTFRTNAKAEEGGAGCKNAILVGRKATAGWHAGGGGGAGGAASVVRASEAHQAGRFDLSAADVAAVQGGT
jgi:hypothetical protein